MHAGTAAIAATGGTAAAGLGLFGYNKENFGFDAGMRFGRFMMARGFANAQVGQYREDIAGITGMTVSKMDAWQTVTTLFLAVGAALSCAGRIGMHGCAPPGWYCALFSGSIFASVMFNGTSLWLSMHASLRAQCAATSLLTRKIRLPIPSMAQLDQARLFGSSFEKQELRDIFRVPFMQHPEKTPTLASATEPPKKGGKKVSQDEFGSTARESVPSWIRDEAVVDKAGGFADEDDGETLHDYHEVPDHFHLLSQAQKEWRDYDVYARITMLFGVVSFLYAVTYYAVGTAIAELRGFWVMWSLPIVFMTAQMLILRLDILQTAQFHRFPHFELFSHLAPFFAVAACTCEYHYFYSEWQTAVTWGLVFTAFAAHTAMAIRMMDLAWPATPTMEMPEEPGKQWWPSSWAVPQAFTRNLWFITPPAKLMEGQHDLLHEMEDLGSLGGGFASGRAKRRAPKSSKEGANEGAYEGANSPFEAFNARRATNLPWNLVRVAIGTHIFQWVFMIAATTAEVILGPESLLKPPGEPPWIRDMKYRTFTMENSIHTSETSKLPGNYRLFDGVKAHYSEDGEEGHSAGHRLLSEVQNASGKSPGALEDLLKLMPKLAELADSLGGERAEEIYSLGDVAPTEPIQALPSNFMGPVAKAKDVQWPAMFEPKHLVCHPDTHEVIALARRGFGALASVGDEAHAAEAFALGGLAGHGRIVGAARMKDGLELVTSTGSLLECPGMGPQDGIWQCKASSNTLPIPHGAELHAAALAERAEGGRLLGLVFKHMPHAAAVFRGAAGAWAPHGEVHMPPGLGQEVGLSFSGPDALLFTAKSGEVHRRHVASGDASAHVAPFAGQASFHSACTSKAGLVRLALRPTGENDEGTWTPQMFIGA